MKESQSDSNILNSQEMEAIYSISRVVTRATEMDASLDEIIGIARTVFIFDNVVLYLEEHATTPEPSYARAIGRGRNSEVDQAWGETIASEVLARAQNVVRKEQISEDLTNRMQLRYFLGIPLTVGLHRLGALIFVRYGGPEFTSEHVHLAEYIAGHIAQLCEHGHLTMKLSHLEAERQLERLQDDFVATVSHELRTPLGFIKGYATTLLRDDTTWDETARREFLTIIDEEADRLRELIDNLLDSSRLQSGTLHMEFQPIRLDSMLHDICLRARSFSQNLDIDLELQARDVLVQADPTRLAQVFDNLFSNAVKYAPGSPLTVNLNVNENHVHISVRDYGAGIAPAHLANIFKRFYRVPNPNSTVRGTGLGLFICRQLVRAHGGEITAESTVGEGTVFHIQLPLA